MIIFHDVDKEDGYLSNWYPSPFCDSQGMPFISVEQYIMYHKARCFCDTFIMSEVMRNTNPATIKALGRMTKGYKEQVWARQREAVLLDGLYYKFTQNPILAQQLLRTGNQTLVEGTATDRVYANGLRRDDPNRFITRKWKGKNLLGYSLMKIRKDLRSIYGKGGQNQCP